jgi:hypothetical protein
MPTRQSPPASIDRLVHDVNTALTVVKTYSQTLVRAAQTGRDLDRANLIRRLERIDAAASRAALHLADYADHQFGDEAE